MNQNQQIKLMNHQEKYPNDGKEINLFDRLRCDEVQNLAHLCDSAIIQPSVGRKPWTPNDFRAIRSNDNYAYNYAATFLYRTFAPRQQIEGLIQKHLWNLESQPVDIRDDQLALEAPTVKARRKKGEKVKSEVQKSIIQKKYCTSKFKLPLRRPASSQRDMLRLPVVYCPTVDTFAYTPVSVSEDNIVSHTTLSTSSTTKVPVMTANVTSPITKQPADTAEDTETHRPDQQFITSYSWDCLPLGTEWGTRAFNLYNRKQGEVWVDSASFSGQLPVENNFVSEDCGNNSCLLPLQMLQIVNTLRPNTYILPQPEDSGEALYHIPTFHISSHHLECDIIETVDDILSSRKYRNHIWTGHVEQFDINDQRNQPDWKLNLPSSEVDELFQTMLAQEVDDGSYFRQEIMYLPPSEVIDSLRSLENDVYRLQEFETELLKN